MRYRLILLQVALYGLFALVQPVDRIWASDTVLGDSAGLPEPVVIDLNRVIQIESSGNPMAYNKRSQARGLCQITPIVLTEYNQLSGIGRKFNKADLFNPSINKRVAAWYLSKRIPQMLMHFKKPVSVENVLIAYNAGISYVVNGKSLPMETRKYIERYYHGTS